MRGVDKVREYVGVVRVVREDGDSGVGGNK